MQFQHGVKDYKHQIIFLLTGTLFGLCIGFAIQGYFNRPKDGRRCDKDGEEKDPAQKKVNHPKGGKKFETGQMSFSEIQEESLRFLNDDLK